MCFVSDSLACEPRFKMGTYETSEIGRPILLGTENFSFEVYWFPNSSLVYRKQKVPKEYALNMLFLFPKTAHCSVFKPF